MNSHGVSRIVGKRLSENDNSKNQIYLGSAINVVTNMGIRVIQEGGKRPRHIADVDLDWISPSGLVSNAPRTKLILYPKYPEVRLSGFLERSPTAPKFLAGRLKGRVLLLGMTESQKVMAYAAAPESSIAKYFWRDEFKPNNLLFDVDQGPVNSKTALIAKLRRTQALGWIKGKRLKKNGLVEYNSRNGIGYTLEAELGVVSNSLKNPDFRGWELKAHTIKRFEKPVISTPISLFTPEPDGGYYVDAGFHNFMKRYGYPDEKGRQGRTNYVATHRVGVPATRNNVTLELEGFDSRSNSIQDLSGKAILIAPDGCEIASWSFPHLLNSWNKKHRQAVYIPAIAKTERTKRSYWYHSIVRLGEGTNFKKFLIALADGSIFIEPGHKMVEKNGQVTSHKRTQWRIKSPDLPPLYDHMISIDVSND